MGSDRAEASRAVASLRTEGLALRSVSLGARQHEQGFIFRKSNDVGACGKAVLHQSVERIRTIPAFAAITADVKPAERIPAKAGTGCHDDRFPIEKIYRDLRKRQHGAIKMQSRLQARRKMLVGRQALPAGNNGVEGLDRPCATAIETA